MLTLAAPAEFDVRRDWAWAADHGARVAAKASKNKDLHILCKKTSSHSNPSPVLVIPRSGDL